MHGFLNQQFEMFANRWLLRLLRWLHDWLQAHGFAERLVRARELAEESLQNFQQVAQTLEPLDTRVHSLRYRRRAFQILPAVPFLAGQ